MCDIVVLSGFAIFAIPRLWRLFDFPNRKPVSIPVYRLHDLTEYTYHTQFSVKLIIQIITIIIVIVVIIIVCGHMQVQLWTGKRKIS